MQELQKSFRECLEEERREKQASQGSQAPLTSPASQCASAPVQPMPGGQPPKVSSVL